MADVSSTTGVSSHSYHCDPQSATDRPPKPKLSTPPIQKHPAAVARRNARERNRVRQVNMGFVTLRNHIPQNGTKSKKLSKVETLRQAANYIRYLREVLTMDGAPNVDFGLSCDSPPLSRPLHGAIGTETSNFVCATPVGPNDTYFGNVASPYASAHCSDHQQAKLAQYCHLARTTFKISPSSSTDSPQRSSFGSSGSSELANAYQQCVTPPQLRHYHSQQAEFQDHHQSYQSPLQSYSMKMYS